LRPVPPEPLRRFLALYSEGRFWDSHEALEDEWRRTGSAFYQALILYASAWVHSKRRNAHGVGAQAEKALTRLADYPSPYLGFDVDALRAHCVEIRDRMAPGFDRWQELQPLPLSFEEERVRGSEVELAEREAPGAQGGKRAR